MVKLLVYGYGGGLIGVCTQGEVGVAILPTVKDHLPFLQRNLLDHPRIRRLRVDLIQFLRKCGIG